MDYPNHVHAIGVSDPHILADKKTGKYYMTSSGFTIYGKDRGRGFQRGVETCLVSEDLIHWSDPVTIFDSTGTDFWGSMSGYPATEMHEINGKILSLRQRQRSGLYAQVHDPGGGQSPGPVPLDDQRAVFAPRLADY